MSKTEIFLLLIILLILGSALWFIFSDEIWVLVNYLETSLYPTLITPE
ncbi:Ecr family regulatory small membrane protein [Klebsiella aerogenes]